MTKKELINKLKDLMKKSEGWPDSHVYSPDTAHIEADKLLLAYIGDEEVTKAFRAIEKWYA